MAIEKERDYIFTWKIENFASCGFVGRIKSPTFHIEYLCGVNWFLKFHPNEGLYDGNKNYMSLYLSWEKSSNAIKTMEINFTFDILHENECVISNRSLQHIFSDAEPDWGYKIMLRKDLLKEKIKNWKEDTLIIRCRVENNSVGMKQMILRSEACTTIGVDRCCINWDVKLPISFEFSENVSFSFLGLYNFDVTLSSYLEAGEMFIHFKKRPAEENQRISFKISFSDRFGSALAIKPVLKSFISSETWKFPFFITKKDLESCKVGLFYYEFKVNFVLSSSKGVASSKFTEHLHFKPSAILSKPIVKTAPVFSLLNDFESLYNSKKYSDVIIRAQNKEFPAHKLVLQVRSPVFAAMFEQNMLENRTNVVEMTDVEIEDFTTFLRFLYMGNVKGLNYEKAMKLILIADKYQVTSLVDICATHLTSVLSIENVCDIFTIADLTNCENLKSCAFGFIKMNTTQLFSTPYWLQWIEQNIKLASFIIFKLSADFKAIC